MKSNQKASEKEKRQQKKDAVSISMETTFRKTNLGKGGRKGEQYIKITGEI